MIIESTDWKPDYNQTPRRIVCAALKKGDRIITGARHFDKVMRSQILVSEGLTFWKSGVYQGFIDQFGDFLDREEAWKIADSMGQIIDRVSNDGTLYSENLY